MVGEYWSADSKSLSGDAMAAITALTSGRSSIATARSPPIVSSEAGGVGRALNLGALKQRLGG